MSNLYRHEESSRRPAIVGLVFSGFFLGFCYTYPAPWYFFVPVVLCTAMCLGAFIANRLSGLRLTDIELTMYAGKWKQSVPLTEITVVNIKQWMEGAPDFSLNMRDGRNISIPGYCIGTSKDFTAALSRLNIPTQIN
jgi:hypothetical protein